MQVEFEAKRLDFLFDTGDQSGSQLWERFADEFAPLPKHGAQGTQRVEEVGGANERPTIELPKVELNVGGLNARLQPAHVFFKPVGNDFDYGSLGMDVLSQARRELVDFASMNVTLSR